MHKNTMKGLLNLMSNKAKTTAYLGATTLMALPGFAMAADDFDGTVIVGKVVTYTAIGVTILAAFALGRWTLRALGLIGGSK